jgi:hypothetical protein
LAICARQAAVGGAHGKVHLGRQYVGVARPARQNLSEEGFRGAPAIDIGRVDEVDAKLERAIDAGDGVLARHADAIGQPRSERDFRNLEIAGAKLAVLHRITFSHDCVMIRSRAFCWLNYA